MQDEVFQKLDLLDNEQQRLVKGNSSSKTLTTPHCSLMPIQLQKETGIELDFSRDLGTSLGTQERKNSQVTGLPTAAKLGCGEASYW